MIRELDNELTIIKKEIKENVLHISCERKSEIAKCPYCGTASGKLNCQQKRVCHKIRFLDKLIESKDF